MKAIEFEAVAENHILKLPEGIPEGKKLRILLLFDDDITTDTNDIKSQLLNLTEGLTDEELKRNTESGREVPDCLS